RRLGYTRDSKQDPRSFGMLAVRILVQDGTHTGVLQHPLPVWADPLLLGDQRKMSGGLPGCERPRPSKDMLDLIAPLFMAQEEEGRRGIQAPEDAHENRVCERRTIVVFPCEEPGGSVKQRSMELEDEPPPLGDVRRRAGERRPCPE